MVALETWEEFELDLEDNWSSFLWRNVSCSSVYSHILEMPLLFLVWEYTDEHETSSPF